MSRVSSKDLRPLLSLPGNRPDIPKKFTSSWEKVTVGRIHRVSNVTTKNKERMTKKQCGPSIKESRNSQCSDEQNDRKAKILSTLAMMDNSEKKCKTKENVSLNILSTVSQRTQDKKYLARISNNHMKEKLAEIFGRQFGSERPFAELFNRKKNNVTADEVVSQTIGIFKRRLRRKKMKPIARFRKLAKFVLLLLRLWNFHSKRVHEVVESFDALDLMTQSYINTNNLLFDVTNYRADTEAKVSQDAKRILKKRPGDRNPKEVYHLLVALRNYPLLAAYPVYVLREIAKRAWYEGFPMRKIIVHEGDLPVNFYYILSGSAVVSLVDSDTHRRKVDYFLRLGDSFGEKEINEGIRRQTTVISKDKIELLCLAAVDFEEIFLSASGLRNPNDPFLRSLQCLKGWPIEYLAENPEKVLFNFFKRGSVVVKDSRSCEWIYVVKSGSCRVLKELQITQRKCKRKSKRRDIWRDKDAENDDFLSHEEELQLRVDDEIQRQQRYHELYRSYDIPEINIDTHSAYHVNRNHLRPMASATVKPTIVQTVSDARRPSFSQPAMKGAYMLRTNPSQATEEEESHNDDISNNELRKLSCQSLESTSSLVTSFHKFNDTRSRKTSTWTNMEPSSTFVTLLTLTKGSVFGLSDVLFEDQPNLSVVSNGAECIMINKKFYLEHATPELLHRLNTETNPYPSEDDLQKSLEVHSAWSQHRKQTLSRALAKIKVQKSDLNDARALLIANE